MVSSLFRILFFFVAFCIVLFSLCPLSHRTLWFHGCLVIEQQIKDRRNLNPAPAGVMLREFIPPLVVFLSGDFAVSEFLSLIQPCVQIGTEFSCGDWIAALRRMQRQNRQIVLTFVQALAVHILQGKQRMHQSDKGINIRHIQCGRVNRNYFIEKTCYGGLPPKEVH